jgi:hypothetical protein
MWRGAVTDEARAVAAGTLPAEDASLAGHYAAELLTATDAALDAFVADLRAAGPQPSDAQALAAVERVVLALNDINCLHGAYETLEREDLCEYIDQALTEHGVDVSGLAARNGVDRSEITDEWREW